MDRRSLSWAALAFSSSSFWDFSIASCIFCFSLATNSNFWASKDYKKYTYFKTDMNIIKATTCFSTIYMNDSLIFLLCFCSRKTPTPKSYSSLHSIVYKYLSVPDGTGKALHLNKTMLYTLHIRTDKITQLKMYLGFFLFKSFFMVVPVYRFTWAIRA